MAGKKVSLTPQGHRVMGALAAFIVPKLAADQVLQSAELESLCKSISPGRYDRQITGIVGTVKERFASRLAQDENLDALPKLLSALMPTSVALDAAKEACDEDGEDALPPEFIKKAKDKKAADSDEDDEDLGPDEDEDDDNEDFDEEGEEIGDSKKAKDKKAKDAELASAKPEIDMKSKAGDAKAKDAALDAALDAARNEGATLAIDRLNARYEAAEAVKHVVGKVNPLAQDASAIYKMALDIKGADLNGVPRVAYKSLFNALNAAEVAARNPKGPRFAQDSAVTKALQDEFKFIPGKA